MTSSAEQERFYGCEVRQLDRVTAQDIKGWTDGGSVEVDERITAIAYPNGSSIFFDENGVVVEVEMIPPGASEQRRIPVNSEDTVIARVEDCLAFVKFLAQRGPMGEQMAGIKVERGKGIVGFFGGPRDMIGRVLRRGI